MRVLVCGGRDLDPNKVCAWLRASADETIGGAPTFIIHGGANGADLGAAHWRNLTGLPGHTFPANWKEHGNAAGPIRNAQMLKDGNPGVVIAFPGGNGTADMVEKARRAGVRVIEAAGSFGKEVA